MKAQLSPRDLALTLAVVALWGYTFVPIRIALDEVPPFALAALRFLFAAAGMIAFAAYKLAGGWAVPHAIASMSLLAWGCVLVMSYGATLFGFGTWNALLHRYPTALISPFALLIPVSGLASGALFLGETLVPVQIAGVALVFAGLVVNVYGLKMRAWLARRM